MGSYAAMAPILDVNAFENERGAPLLNPEVAGANDMHNGDCSTVTRSFQQVLKWYRQFRNSKTAFLLTITIFTTATVSFLTAAIFMNFQHPYHKQFQQFEDFLLSPTGLSHGARASLGTRHAVLAPPLTRHFHDFEDFVRRHNKQYASVEEKARRFEVFARNKIYVDLHNAQNYSFSLAVNAFADLTSEEFQQLYSTGYRPRPRAPQNATTAEEEPEEFWSSASATFSSDKAVSAPMHPASTPSPVPEAVNWINKGCVTPVKDQKKCGSCWAFSASGAVESAYCIKHGVLESLSEQQLVDCAKAEGNNGCNGGEMDGAFEYMIKEKGLCFEKSYPYTAKKGKCEASHCKARASVSQFVDIAHKSESALMTALAQHGPVAVAIQADQLPFQLYHDGVFDAPCGRRLNHAVLAVGYGTDDRSGKDYWLIKNSWGATWGNQGYIKLARKASSKAGECGVLLEPSFPVVA